jgi:hypothetical protein
VELVTCEFRLLPRLLVAENQVDPLVQVLADLLALELLAVGLDEIVAAIG